MDDSGRVGGVDRPGQGRHQPGGFPGWQEGGGEFPVQAAARAVLEGEERNPAVLADLVDLDHVGVAEPGDGPGLVAQARPLGRPDHPSRFDHLQRRQPTQGRLPREVDDPHPALAEFPLDLVPRRRVPTRGRAGESTVRGGG